MLKKVLAVAVAFGLATGAQASDFEVSGYLQGNLGQAKAKKPSAVKAEQRDFKDIGGRTSSDRTDLAYKLIVGLQLNQYVAVEGQYIDLGKAKYKGRDSWSFEGGSGFYQDKLDMKTSGFGFNVVGSYPVTEDFSVFAKTGLHYLKTKGTLKDSWGVSVEGEGAYIESGKGSKSVRKWTNSIGIGASYQIIPNLSVVGEYERYRNVADKKVRVYDEKIKFKHNVDYLSVGLRYSF